MKLKMSPVLNGRRNEWTKVIPPVHFHQRSWSGRWGWAQWSPKNQTKTDFHNDADKTLNNSTFKLEFGQNKRFLLDFYCPQVATITTSKKAFICFWTRLTNLHWITRLLEETEMSNEGADFKIYFISNKRPKNEKCDHVLTLCTHFCSHLWPPCLIRWASDQPGTSEMENSGKAKANVLLTPTRWQYSGF